MKPLIPLSALIIYLTILGLIYSNIIPNPIDIIDYIKSLPVEKILFSMFLIILLESIIYVGFYLPGQFIAVVLVLSYSQNIYDIAYLTLISIVAVTLGATINYAVGYTLSKNNHSPVNTIDYTKLLISMIHINTIALFIFDQGIKKAPKKIILITGLLNLPYYFLILLITYLLKDEIMGLAENSYIVMILLLGWLIYSLHKNRYKIL